MNPTDWRVVTELFGRCLDVSLEEREAVLADADPALADEVRSLLENSDSRPLQIAMDGEFDVPCPTPTQIGPYRVERLLGQGGMGSVFLARREGEFDQIVAIKLIRRDLGTWDRGLQQRFLRERQILASLQHPNIAHLIDGGAVDGSPFLVVEYVEGLRIDEYCNQNRLGIRQRIELFLEVCSAVQYAHQNLIVHRDLKPANVLVPSGGVPKLLDFGIAKLLGGTDRSSELTQTALRIFTPSYASPEQLRGEQIGTSTDVYSLGVMLYELLTGKKPFRVEGISDLAILDAITRQAPPLASAAIKRYPSEEREARAAERSIAYRNWVSKLKNDLDLILSRAISADAVRRYQTVDQFSTDLKRYLAMLPINARKDSWSYRAGKFWKRHTALVSVTTLALVSLLAGSTALWRANRISIQQRQRAEHRFNDLHALAHSNITEVQDALDRVPGGTAVRALILSRALQYLEGLSAEKDSDIDLQRELATAYQKFAEGLGSPAGPNLGDTAAANLNYDHSIRIRESILTLPQATERDHFFLIHTRYQMALMQFAAGQLEAGRRNVVRAANESDALLAGHPQNLAVVQYFVGLTHSVLMAVLFDREGPSLADPVSAVEEGAIALPAAEFAYSKKPNDPIVIETTICARYLDGDALFGVGREEEGLRLQRSALDLANASSAKLPSKSLSVLLSAKYRYGINVAKGNPRVALPILEEVLAQIAAAKATDPADTKLKYWSAIGRTTIGNVYLRAGERTKGLKMMELGMAEVTTLLAGNPSQPGELRFRLAAGHHGLGEDALNQGNLRLALSEYKSADDVYGDEAASFADDLGVYLKRAENRLRMAAVQERLGLVKDASASQLIAVESVDRVLKAHPDNLIAQKLRGEVHGAKGF